MKFVPITIPQRAMFIRHSGFAHTIPMVERLAERLSECGDLKLAAEECGISHDYAKNLFGLIRKGLGGQAT